MLSDRPYMRGDYQRETTSVTTWLVCAIAGAFLIQFAADSRWLAARTPLTREFALSVDALAAGRIWTPLTHWLLHSTSNLFHVGLVLAGLFLLGRVLVKDLGARRFIGVFAGSVLTGALVWGALNWRTGGELIGSTAGLYGLLAVYALLYPNREFNFLLFFFFPVTLRPKHVAASLCLVDSLALVLVNVFDRALPFPYAPSAHLGGMLAGYTYYQFLHESSWRFGRSPDASAREYPASQSTVSAADETADPATTSGRSHADIRAQVDRVLDKINSEGFGALTPEERRILDDAKDLLSRR